MVQVTALPPDVLSTIFSILAMSRGGLRDLARVSATCQLFNSYCTDQDFLRKLTFNSRNVRFVGRREIYHHTNGLLSRSVRAGNPSAECMLAKVILNGGTWLWRMMLENELTNSSIKCATTLPLSERLSIAKSLITDSIADLPYILFSSEDDPDKHESYARLQHTRLVKSFVLMANLWDLIRLRLAFKEYVEFFVGYHRYFDSRINDIIDRMIFCECMEHPVVRLRIMGDPRVRQIYDSLRLPVGSRSYRDQLILALENLLG